MTISWTPRGGYECSSKGDSRFSALFAKMPDGRTIEQWYQCDIKGYEPGGTNWKLGKGKPPRYPYQNDQLWEMYLNLWRLWAIRNIPLMQILREEARKNDNLLSDCFDNTHINQARALAIILNEWFGG